MIHSVSNKLLVILVSDLCDGSRCLCPRSQHSTHVYFFLASSLLLKNHLQLMVSIYENSNQPNGYRIILTLITFFLKNQRFFLLNKKKKRKKKSSRTDYIIKLRDKYYFFGSESNRCTHYK